MTATVSTLSAAGAVPATVVGGAASLEGFSLKQNPYLFPRNLLDSGQRSATAPRSAIWECSVPYATSGVDVPKWSLVHTKPRQEKKLAEHLAALGVPHYLPVTRCKAVTRGRTRITQAVLFPGYLFARWNWLERLTALETNRIVATHPVADELGMVEHLWDLADLIEKGVPLRIEERIVSGQYVRVKSGLLRDKCGVVMKRVGKSRLFVLVNEFLGGVSLEIEQHLLEPYRL